MRDRQPAIQNIPIRTDLGRRLRDVLLKQQAPLRLPDYTALELRLMATLVRRR